MFGLGPAELILILVIALVIFGPAKLPEMGKALGSGIKEFKKATSSVKDEMRLEAADDKSQELADDKSQEAADAELKKG
ncbi:Sec-independent protein translocase subunit TatA/TatB [Phosphitispora fastidiosa]|uniref:Sec-independent protein translocase subunit TatA/TatB n=1 Tax=Phosphitispora fastidiosa TaxID=2837202 RepID=UPI001E523A3C|nr:twin-arginine translocase TatA/TatE family subunit [Phosphitispora fastidiosa]MBU7008154.1 sec-independent protein translocase protein TatA [Phosphitispora fastidiosa]